MVSGRKSRGSQNRDSRYGSSVILGWQVGDLEGPVRLGLFGIVCFAGRAELLVGRARVRRCTAGRRSLSSYMSILARCWLALGIRILGVRIQLTAGGWGWRGLAGGCCCEGVA